MVDACVALAADRDNNLAAPRMEWIKDPHFNRQTPGIMTLVRPASARVGSHARSVTRPVGITARSSINACRDCSMCSRACTRRRPSRPAPRSLARVELLILDDWGLAPMTAEQRRDLLEIIDDRHGRGSVGLLARSATRPAATTAPSSIIACPGCSMRWRSLAVTAAMRGPQEPGTRRFVDPRRLGPCPAHPRASARPLEIIDNRHGRGSTIVTSQLPVDHWHEVIGNPTIADAILDRLVHNAHRLTLKGDSMPKVDLVVLKMSSTLSNSR